MEQPRVSEYPVDDFREWSQNGALILQPKFQRRDVWIPKAKSFLIDTILRGLPIPPLYLRWSIDNQTERAVREVVDGQQRVRTVLAFMDDDFPILRVHNREYGGKRFSEMPRAAQNRIRSYKFTVNQLDEISDAEVLSLFARINTYTVQLNAQELRNAEYFGAFKQLVYRLSLDYYPFWTTNGIFSDAKIARMAEAELVSELLAMMVGGIQSTRASDLKKIYAKYDDEFDEDGEIEQQFRSVMDLIGEMSGGKLRSTAFRREPLFLSLFIALYDALFGLPGSTRPHIRFSDSSRRDTWLRLTEVSGITRLDDPPAEYRAFVEASARATADAAKRKTRHDFIWDFALKP
jgi:hypothetical protein